MRISEPHQNGAQKSDAALALLARLVAFDTTSHKSNLSLLAFIENYLAEHGIAAERVMSPCGEKASLFATIGPADIGGVALSGHTDTVPVAGQTWESDPFNLTERDGRFHGRGTADMKGFIACCLAMVPDLVRRKLTTPVHLVFSYDEEIGCIGVRPMIAEFGRRLVRPRLVIVGEPTAMRVVDAHKGPIRWQADMTGRAAHSSMPHLGVNAIRAAGRLLGELDRIAEILVAESYDARFDPPHSTLQATRIEGGAAANIVPESCRLEFEVRALAGLDLDALETKIRDFCTTRILPQMRAVAPEADIVLTRGNHVAPFSAGPHSEAVALALRWSGQNETGAVSYATEAGFFQGGGVPAVICGPGDIAQAHTANEWIARSEIFACLTFLDRLADWAEGTCRL